MCTLPFRSPKVIVQTRLIPYLGTFGQTYSLVLLRSFLIVSFPSSVYTFPTVSEPVISLHVHTQVTPQVHGQVQKITILTNTDENYTGNIIKELLTSNLFTPFPLDFYELSTPSFLTFNCFVVGVGNKLC